MDKAKLIEKLNDAIALELGAVIQYNHYGQVLVGPDRRLWSDFFIDTASEAFKHAKKFGSRVVALGGVPATEPVPTKQASDIHEMLVNSLEVEKNAVRVYTEALECCKDSPAYRNLLEDQILDEQTDVENLEKYLNQVEKVQTAQPRRNIQSA